LEGLFERIVAEKFSHAACRAGIKSCEIPIREALGIRGPSLFDTGPTIVVPIPLLGLNFSA
jgi:hypothetical protein